MQAVLDAIERIPVATITHALVALVLGADLVIHGSLSPDALKYAAIVTTGNVGIGASRSYVAGKKHEARAKASTVRTTYAPVRPDFSAVSNAPTEPGDPDGLSHISTANPGQVPPDEGDAGTEAPS